jgi:ATP-dependent protease ClpP protease subunit
MATKAKEQEQQASDEQMTQEVADAMVAAYEEITATKKAERIKTEAEAEKAKAEAAYALAQARKESALADKAEIDLEREDDKRSFELVSNDKLRVYDFTEPVGAQSVEKCIATFRRWSRLDERPTEYEINFFSPGGSVIHGMALFDYIRRLQGEGFRFTTKALGYAASMAGILMQVGDRRVMARESWLLIHQGSAGAIGSMGEIEDTVEWFKKIDERILDIFYERSHREGVDAAQPLSRTTIKKKYARRDWWLSSDVALKHGFVDEVE